MNATSPRITRRETLKFGAGILAGAATVKANAKPSRIHEYSWVRGFKMIPVIFNGWHSLVDFGGFSREQL